MASVQSPARKCSMCCGNLTFDQPLYLKSVKIKQGNHPQFQHLFIRVSGFHQLKSFVGAECKFMEDSGLDVLWPTIYAKNSLPKMMEGKNLHKNVEGMFTDRCCTIYSSSTSS